MGRHVFFSFKYKPDVWRANSLRKQTKILGVSTTGYWDDSIYEPSLASNPEYIRRKIREALEGTLVTVILVTFITKKSQYVKYEYDKSIEKKNGILQLDVSDMEGPDGRVSSFDGWLSYVSKGIRRKWSHNCPLGDWIEEAYQNR